ncbi:MAG: hypothetical protein P1P82_12505 [Bacteroidales bacterium]|nr:hypothetical protein [Bacteroidales bacterium]
MIIPDYRRRTSLQEVNSPDQVGVFSNDSRGFCIISGYPGGIFSPELCPFITLPLKAAGNEIENNS